MRCDMPTRSSASCTRFLRSADGIPRYVSGSSTFSYTVRSPIRLKAWKMNPISRLRMRARAESFSPCTALPFKIYEPSLGESSKPKIASKVDLPQPEGPAIDRYSPFLMCRWMPASACVSTSSVTNTFVTPSRLIKAFGSFAMYIPFAILSSSGCDCAHPRSTYPTILPDRQPLNHPQLRWCSPSFVPVPPECAAPLFHQHPV